jgi:MFS family permease
MLVLMQGAFTGLWSVYVTYFVVFFIDRMHYSLSEAGAIFATATFIGLPGRMLWGYAAGRWMSSNAVLALLGFFTTFTVILTGFNSAAWPTWALLTVAVGVNIASTGWQGIALSEMARLSPPGKVGAVTGSIIGLSCIGQVIMPPMFAVVLWLTDSYALGFTLVAIPTSVVGVMMLVSDRRTVHEAK